MASFQPYDDEILKALDEIVDVRNVPEATKVRKRSSILKAPKNCEDAGITEDLTKRKSFGQKRVSFADRFQVMELCTGNVYDVPGKNGSENSLNLDIHSETKSEGTVLEENLNISKVQVTVSSTVKLQTKHENYSQSQLSGKHKISVGSDFEPKQKRSSPWETQNSDLENVPPDLNASLWNVYSQYHELQMEQEKENKKLSSFQFSDNLAKNTCSEVSKNVLSKRLLERNRMINNTIQENSSPAKDERLVNVNLSQVKASSIVANIHEQNSSLMHQESPDPNFSTLSNLPLQENKENIYMDPKNKNILESNSRHFILNNKLCQGKAPFVEPSNISYISPEQDQSLLGKKSYPSKVLSGKEKSTFNETLHLNQTMDFTCILPDAEIDESEKNSVFEDYDTEKPCYMELTCIGKGTNNETLSSDKFVSHSKTRHFTFDDMEITCQTKNIFMNRSIEWNENCNSDLSRSVLDKSRAQSAYLCSTFSQKNIEDMKIHEEMCNDDMNVTDTKHKFVRDDQDPPIDSNILKKSHLHQNSIILTEYNPSYSTYDSTEGEKQNKTHTEKSCYMELTCIGEDANNRALGSDNFASHSKTRYFTSDEMDFTCKTNVGNFDSDDINASDTSYKFVQDDQDPSIDSDILNKSHLHQNSVILTDTIQENNPRYNTYDSTEGEKSNKAHTEETCYMELTCIGKSSENCNSDLSRFVLDNTEVQPAYECYDSPKDNREVNEEMYKVDMNVRDTKHKFVRDDKDPSIDSNILKNSHLHQNSVILTAYNPRHSTYDSTEGEKQNKTHTEKTCYMELTCIGKSSENCNSDLPGSVLNNIEAQPAYVCYDPPKDNREVNEEVYNDDMNVRDMSYKFVQDDQNPSIDASILKNDTLHENCALLAGDNQRSRTCDSTGEPQNHTHAGKTCYMELTCIGEDVNNRALGSPAKFVGQSKTHYFTSDEMEFTCKTNVANFDSNERGELDVCQSNSQTEEISPNDCQADDSTTFRNKQLNLSFKNQSSIVEIPTNNDHSHMKGIISGSSGKNLDANKPGILYVIKKLKAASETDAQASDSSSMFPEIFLSLTKKPKPPSFSSTKIELSKVVQNAIRQSCSFNYGREKLSFITEVETANLSVNDKSDFGKGPEKSVSQKFSFNAMNSYSDIYSQNIEHFVKNSEKISESRTFELCHQLESSSQLDLQLISDSVLIASPQSIIDNHAPQIKLILESSLARINSPQEKKSMDSEVEQLHEDVSLNEVFIEDVNKTHPPISVCSKNLENEQFSTEEPTEVGSNLQCTKVMDNNQNTKSNLPDQFLNTTDQPRPSASIFVKSSSAENMETFYQGTPKLDEGQHKQLPQYIVPESISLCSTTNFSPSSQNPPKIVIESGLNLESDEVFTDQSDLQKCKSVIKCPGPIKTPPGLHNVKSIKKNKTAASSIDENSQCQQTEHRDGNTNLQPQFKSSEKLKEIESNIAIDTPVLYDAGGFISPEKYELYDRLSILREEILEATQKQRQLLYLREMDGQQVVFELMRESLFGRYVMFVPLSFNSCNTSSTITLKPLSCAPDKVDELGLLYFKTLKSFKVQNSPMNARKFIEEIFSYVDAAKIVKKLLKDVWLATASHVFTIHFNQDLPRMEVKFTNIKPTSVFNLTFPLNLKTYPQERIVPEFQHLEFKEIEPSTILNITKKVEPGEKYLCRMVRSCEDL